jgi:prepilin-type N-terminal cleavage/methylation domain-containing protein
MKNKKLKTSKAFTLIELLVVVSIIALLAGILAPGMRIMVRTAKDLKQKSRFHSMEVGLEFYSKDFDGYPPSKFVPAGDNPNTTGNVEGAQHLAEALVGRDMKGVDARTQFYASAEPANIYTDQEESINKRKGPYVEFEEMAVFELREIYGPGNTGNLFESTDDSPSPVFVDVYGHRKITVIDSEGNSVNVKVGTPIIYFNADENVKAFRTQGQPYTWENFKDWTYNYTDNMDYFELTPLKNEQQKHQFSESFTKAGKNGIELFYEEITNEEISQYYAPYKPKSFILMSAGYDGIFGTKDDVTNY